jgi:hypothetical protein
MPTDRGFDASYRVLARTLPGRAPGFHRCPAALLDALLADAELVRIAGAAAAG